METGTQAVLIIGLTTFVLPCLMAAGITRVLMYKGQKQAGLVGLGLGFLVSFGGVLEVSYLWGNDAIKWFIWAPFLGGGLLYLLNLRHFKKQFKVRALSHIVLASILILCSALTLSPLGSLWQEGIGKPLLNEWLISGLLLAWFTCKESTSDEISPAHLASLALCYAFAAPVIGLSGSASVAQLLVAYGCSTASVGLVALWQRHQLTPITYVMSYLGLFVSLMYAHFYLVPALPMSATALLITAPYFINYSTRWKAQPFKRVIVVLILTLPMVALALGLVALQESQSTALQETDEFGASY